MQCLKRGLAPPRTATRAEYAVPQRGLAPPRTATRAEYAMPQGGLAPPRTELQAGIPFHAVRLPQGLSNNRRQAARTERRQTARLPHGLNKQRLNENSHPQGNIPRAIETMHTSPWVGPCIGLCSASSQYVRAKQRRQPRGQRRGAWRGNNPRLAQHQRNNENGGSITYGPSFELPASIASIRAPSGLPAAPRKASAPSTVCDQSPKCAIPPSESWSPEA